MAVASVPTIDSPGSPRYERAVVADQIFAEAEQPIAALEIEIRQQQVLRGDQLQLELLDLPFLLAELDAAGQGLFVYVAPVEDHVGGRRLVLGPDQAAVGGGQAHQVAEPVLDPIEIGQGLLDLSAEREILIARFGFLVGLAPLRHHVGERLDLLPGRQSAVAADFGRRERPIGEIQFPIRVLHIIDEVPHAGLEVGEADVGVDTGQASRRETPAW